VRARYGYLHVPKAAGSSVMSALHAVAGDRTVYRPTMDRTLFGPFDRFDDLPERRRAMVHTGDDHELAAHDIVIGHFALPSLQAGRQLSDIVMILREPRARLISHYSFWRGWTDAAHDDWEPYGASRRAAELDWPDFVEDPSIAAQTDNVALRLLLGDDPRVPIDDFIDPADSDSLVADAIERLARLGHVDVIEHGDAVWGRLGAWIGHDLRAERRNETVDASGRPTDWPRWFTPRSALALCRRTALDRELWNAAAERHASLGRDALAALAEATYSTQVARVARDPTAAAPASASASGSGSPIDPPQPRRRNRIRRHVTSRWRGNR
jgi:hypothetical protein